MRAIRIQEFGGPEAMGLEELPTPKPGDGQALVRIEAAGVNFIDVYQRTGLYKDPLPVWPRARGRGRRRGGGRRRHDGPRRRPRRVDRHPGIVRDPQRGAGRPARHAARGRRRARGRVRDAPGHDGALPRPLDVPAEARATRAWSTRRRAASGSSSARWRSGRGRGSSGPSPPRRRRSSRARRARDDVILYTRQDFEAEVKRLTGGKRRPGRLRLRRQGHLREGLRLPGAARATWCSTAHRAGRSRRSTPRC